MRITLSAPDKLNIISPSGEVFTGGSQNWYKRRWHKISGCGPVAASNLIWYLTGPRSGMKQYLEIMQEMYSIVTPGIKGVHTSGIFTDGIERYGVKHDLQFTCKVLEIASKSNDRPSIDAVCEFIRIALDSDSPLAFLNLSNGSLNNLESWHWVTIISYDPDSAQIEVCDYGKKLELDISVWLKTSMLGGALIYLE